MGAVICLTVEKLRTEAPVNGGRNSNGQPEQCEGGGLGTSQNHLHCRGRYKIRLYAGKSG